MRTRFTWLQCLPMGVLGRIIPIVLLISNFTTASLINWEAKTYRCTVKDAVNVQKNGHLGQDRITRLKRKWHDGIIIDTLTGALTFPYGDRVIWRIIQEGSAENDYVLSPPRLTESAKRLAVEASDFIRVRAWKEPPVTFVVWRSMTLLTGTCVVVR